MLHLIPIDRTPFKNPDDHVYEGMAFDGIYFYCCTGKSNKIYKLTIDGKLINCFDTKRIYCAICFDRNENCFWAISSGCRSTVFKLNCCMCEISCIKLPCQDRCYHNISYDSLGNILLLCSGNTVEKVSKSGFIFPFYDGEKSAQYEAVAQIFDSYLFGCKFQIGNPDIIGILCSNCYFDYLTCMPKEFLLNSICVDYQPDGCKTLFILATQNYRYSYLLSYKIELDEVCEKSCLPSCCEPVDDDQMIWVSINNMDVQADIII